MRASDGDSVIEFINIIENCGPFVDALVTSEVQRDDHSDSVAAFDVF